MSMHKNPNSGQAKRAVFPRWLVPIYFAVVLPLVLVVAPWGLSLLAPRYGWVAGRPSLLNLFPLILVVPGIACIIWSIALHWRQAPEGWELETTPKYLLTRGPYQFSRNPNYLCVLVILLGWALFYGSIVLLIVCVIWWVVLNYVGVPWEERGLEARFGETYLQYKSKVPRWLGKTRG